jgi:hypothetical protein
MCHGEQPEEVSFCLFLRKCFAVAVTAEPGREAVWRGRETRSAVTSEKEGRKEGAKSRADRNKECSGQQNQDKTREGLEMGEHDQQSGTGNTELRVLSFCFPGCCSNHFII